MRKSLTKIALILVAVGVGAFFLIGNNQWAWIWIFLLGLALVISMLQSVYPNSEPKTGEIPEEKRKKQRVPPEVAQEAERHGIQIPKGTLNQWMYKNPCHLQFSVRPLGELKSAKTITVESAFSISWKMPGGAGYLQGFRPDETFFSFDNIVGRIQTQSDL